MYDIDCMIATWTDSTLDSAQQEMASDHSCAHQATQRPEWKDSQDFTGAREAQRVQFPHRFAGPWIWGTFVNTRRACKLKQCGLLSGHPYICHHVLNLLRNHGWEPAPSPNHHRMTQWQEHHAFVSDRYPGILRGGWRDYPQWTNRRLVAITNLAV